MIKPIISGTVFSVHSEAASFLNRATGEKRDYVKHSIDLLVTEPEKGVALVHVMHDDPSLPIKEGVKIIIPLSSFSVESGTGIFKTRFTDIKVVK